MSDLKKAFTLLMVLLLAPLVFAGSTQIASQSDWIEGTFNSTSADREDNSGNLGIGYENGTVNDSLNGFWRLDKNSGDVLDYSGEGNDGEVYGAQRGIKGILGTNSLNFDGSADEVVIPDDSSLDLTEGFTLNAWINPDEKIDVNPSMSSNPSIVSKGSSYNIEIQNPKTLAYSTGSEIVFLDSKRQKDTVTVTANAIGNLKDFDNDQRLEVPYVNEKNELNLIDRNGEKEGPLASGVKSQNTVLGVGDLNQDGTDAVFYIDSSSGTIYKKEYGGTSSQVDNGLTASAISGVADYNNDGDQEIVYLDGNQELSYWNSNGKTSTGKSVTGAANFKYWLAGSTNPSVGKYDESWQDLSSDYSGGSIQSGADTDEAFYLGDGNGDITRWDGKSFQTKSPFGDTVRDLSSNSTHILGLASGEIKLYDENSDTWTALDSTQINTDNFLSVANSYGSNSGEYWLIGHEKITSGQKSGRTTVTRYDNSGFQSLSGSNDVFGDSVKVLESSGSHFLGYDNKGNFGIYDGSGWSNPSTNKISDNANTVHTIEWGSMDGESFWLVGDGDGNLVKIYEDGSTSEISNPIQNSIQSIRYSEREERFLIGDGSGNIFSYENNNFNEISGSPFDSSVKTIMYNPSTSVKKLGRPSDLEGDGNVEVPVINSNSNIELVNSDGTSKVVDSNYGSAKSTPLGVLDWTGNPEEEILHVDSGTGELKASTVGGSISTVKDSSENTLTGIDSEVGIAAGSRPSTTPVLKINGQNVLNKEGTSIEPGSWTMLTATYNASTGTAELFYNNTEIASTTTGLGTVNSNSQDLKIANGKFNTSVDEVKAFNRSLSSGNLTELFFYGTDGRFEGDYTSAIVNPEGKKSWNEFMLNVNKSTDTSVSATVYSLDGSNNIPQETITIDDGKQNYTISDLPNSKKLKFSLDGYTDDIKETWEVFNSKIYYEESLEAGNVTHNDYSNQHKFNISATAREAKSDNNIAGCEAYYSTAEFSSYYSVDGTSFSESFGDGNSVSCNSTISPDLVSVGYDGSSDYEEVSFKFNFTDNDGYTVGTANRTETLPNNQPDILDTNREVSSTDHEFNFSAVANDQDGDGDVNSCNIYAEDSDGNQHTLEGLNTSYGNSTQASCNATISSSLSGFEAGESIEVYSEFTDVADATSSTAIYTETIPNHDPVIESGPTLEKVSGEHAFDLSAVASDVDSDSSEINSCTVYAEDGDGNTETISGSGLVDQSYGTTDQASCNTSISNSINGFSVGETITVDVKFSDRHGAETENVTGTKEIPNTAPEKPSDVNMTYFLSQEEDLQHIIDHTPKINWTNPTDPEGDEITIKAYTESSANPNQLDTETNSSDEVNLGQNIGLSDGRTYNVSLRACDQYSCSGYTENIEFTMNEEPSIQSVDLNSTSVTGSDSVKLQANITDTQDKIDWANYTVYNQSSGEQIYSNKEGALSSELWNSEAFEVLAGNTYNWTLNTSDGYQTSSTTGTFSVSNSPPEITEPLNTTEYPSAHKFNASAVAYEPDGEINIDKFNITLSDGENQKTFTRNVTKAYGNSSEIAANFSNVNSSTVSGFEVNEEISVSIKFIDNGGKTASTSGNQRIPNKVPDLPQNLNMTYFLQENTDIDHVLDHTPEINWSNPEDPEGDSVTIKAYTGQSSDPTSLDDSIDLGTSYGDSSDLTLGNGVSLSDGTSYNTTLIACDSYGCSSRSENIEFHMNEEPVIENTELNDSSPTGSDFVKLLSNVTDNEDSISDVEFTVWNTDSNTKILSSEPGSEIDGEWNSDKFEVFASTSYNFTVNATDGYEYSLDTGTFSVPNSEPSMVSGPSFQNYESGHKFNVSAIAEDVDGQENFANYTVKLDDGENTKTYTKDLTRSFGGENEAAANFSSVNASTSGFEVGETIFVTVVFRDKSGETTQNFESHTVPNHRPDGASDINMSELLETGTDLQHVIDETPEINFTAPSDPDKDNITLSIYTEASNNPSQLDREVLITENNYSSNQEVEIGNQINLNDGTSYNFSVQTCDQYGNCTTKRNIQEFQTNQEPVFNSVELNKSSSNLADGDEVHLIADISDAESEGINWANFTVYNQTDNDRLIDSLNGSIKENGNWISDTWTVSTGTKYNWTANATDGYETSETSSTFKTNNSNPEIVSGPSFDDIPEEHAFNVSAVVKDADDASDLADYTLVLEDGDGKQKTVENSITESDRNFGTGNEASINFSEVNTSISGFQVKDEVEATITVRDSSDATAQTPTRSNTIPNDVPDEPSDLDMTSFLQENADLDHVIDQTPEINWTNPSDPEGDQITVKAYTGTSSTPTTLDNSTSENNKLSLGQNAEILDGETYNVRLRSCDPYGCSGYTNNIEFTMNQEPFIESVEPNSSDITGSDQIELEANITDSQDSISWANFTVYNQSSGELLFENKEGTLGSELWKSESWETRAGTTYNYTLNTSDGYQSTSSSGTITVNNQQPEITGLSTENYNEGHKFNISATAKDEDGAINIEKFNITISDGDGNQEEIKASVNRDFGTENQAALNYSNINASYFQDFEVEETLNIDVEVIDRSGSSSSSSTETAIPNHLPDLPQNLDLEVGDKDFVVNHSFKINWTNPTDSDNDNLTVKAYVGTDQDPLTVDNSTQITESEYGEKNNLTVGKNVDLEDNEDYNIDLVACDNWDCTSRDTNASFHMNQEPRVESVELNESVSEEAEWIKLIANVTATDNDALDAAFYEIWNQSSPQKLVDEKIDSNSKETWNSSIFYGKSLETYNWTFTASDGFENTTSSDAFEVGNGAPSITEEIGFHDLKDKHGFNVSLQARDVNGDKDLANYTVIADNGEKEKRYTKEFPEDGDEFSWANFSSINSSIEGFEVGESISVQIVVRDEQDQKAYSSTVSHSIPNREHVITDINLKPSEPETTDTLNVSYSVKDPEGDDITNTFYEWTGNSTEVTSKTVSASDTSKGQHWNLSLQVVDEYNSLSQENQSDKTLVIENSQPEIARTQETSNISGKHAYQVSTVVKDVNGETDLQNTCTVDITDGANTATDTTQIETSYSGSEKARCSYEINTTKYAWISPEEQITTNFTVKDEDGAEASTADKTATVPNRRPSVTELNTPENNTETGENELDFDWTANDPEGDNLVYDLKIYNETDLIREEKDLKKAEKTVSGLESSNLSWEVKAYDKFETERLSSNLSETGKVLVDSKPPQLEDSGIEVINSTRDTPLQNQSVRCYSRWSDNFELGDARVYDNATGTNHTISKTEFENGWANITIDSSELTAGQKSCNFYASDHLDNNASSEKAFEVVDTEKPNITGLEYSPSTQSNLDPNNTVQVNATVEDNLRLENVSLLYREEEGEWKPGNLTENGDRYVGNFTPGENETEYEFKYRAVDTYDNVREENSSVFVDWDYNWSKTPAEYEGSSTLQNNLIDYTPIQVTNNGDFDLRYNVTKRTDPNLDVNIRETEFTVPAGESEAISVESRLEDNDAEDEGIYAFQIKIQSENSTAEPQRSGIEGQATFTLDAPFLSMVKGSGFPISVSEGAENVELPVETTNVGTQQAQEVGVSWDVPGDWEVKSDSTSKELGNLTVDETSKKSITVDIPSDASSGTKKINVTGSTTNRSFNELFEIDVTENDTTTIIEDGEDGGGGGMTGSQPSSEEQVTARSDQILNTSENFELVRGEDQNFTIDFNNPTEYNLSNISVEASGFRAQYVELGKEYIDSLDVNSSREIPVQITAPDFFASDSFELNFTISGKGYDPRAFVRPYFDFTLNKIVNLEIHEIPESEAQNLTDEMRDLERELNESGLPTSQVEEIISESESDIEAGNYGNVEESFETAQNTFETATDTQEGLEELSRQIDGAETQGLTVTQSKRMKNLAEAGLERGAYQTASNRLDEARNLYQLETKGEINYVYLITSNWKKILLGLLISGIVCALGYYRYRIYRINYRLEEIDQEERNLHEMKKQDQKEAFEQADMSIDEYEDAAEDYNEDLTGLIEERAMLESQKANLTNFRKAESLKQERDRLKDIIQETQEDYVKGDIADTEIYETKVEELTEKLSSVESELAEIEAKSEHRTSRIPFR